MESRPAPSTPLPTSSVVGQLLGWPLQCGGLACLALSQVGNVTGPPSLALAWFAFAGLLLLVVPGLLLAVQPRLLGGPVGWLIRFIDRHPAGIRRQTSLHTIGIEIAWMGLGYCFPSALSAGLWAVFRNGVLTVAVTLAVCLVLLPFYVVGFWRIDRRDRRQS